MAEKCCRKGRGTKMSPEIQKHLAQQRSLFLNRGQHGKAATSQEKAGGALGWSLCRVQDILWEAALLQQCLPSRSRTGPTAHGFSQGKREEVIRNKPEVGVGVEVSWYLIFKRNTI